MIQRFKYLLIFAAIVGVSAGGLSFMTPGYVSAAEGNSGGGGGCGSGRFLTFPTWYNGLDTKTDSRGNCSVVVANDQEGNGGPLIATIWRIGANVVEIIMQLVAYVSVGFIIYGGFKYIISEGTPDGMANAKKTVLNAVIGLVIATMAVGIINVFTRVLK